MKITRDVIYDLLPAYFAGDVSSDTRALVEQFLESDPEFARMTARFQKLLETDDKEAAGPRADRKVFERARKRAERLQISAAFAIAYGLAALLPLAADFFRGQGISQRSVIIATVFLIVSLASAASWIVAVRQPYGSAKTNI